MLALSDNQAGETVDQNVQGKMNTRERQAEEEGKFHARGTASSGLARKAKRVAEVHLASLLASKQEDCPDPGSYTGPLILGWIAVKNLDFVCLF